MADPVDDFLLAKEAARTARKEKEIELWKTWKQGGQKPEHLEPLLKIYEPNFRFKTRLWKAPAIPESAFKAELQKHFIKALQIYDPDKGAALNTHVERRLYKAMRYNVRNQNMAYVSEGAIGHLSQIQQAHDFLSEELGRPPTPTEIAEQLHMSPKRVETIQKSIRKDVPASAFEVDPTTHANQYEQQQIEIAKGILPQIFPEKPELHTLFNYLYAANGHPKVTSTSELAKLMGKSQPQISRLKSTLGKELRSRMGLTPPEDE